MQDLVETVLMEAGYPDVARAYILYRHARTEVRTVKQVMGVTDDLKLGINAVSVLKRRYLLKDEAGQVIETPAQLFRRVARTIAAPDAHYGASPMLFSKPKRSSTRCWHTGSFSRTRPP